MNNVIKFEPRRKRPEQSAKISFWTPEKLAWPAFILLVLIALVLQKFGMLPSLP